MAWTVLCLILKVVTSNTNLRYKVMGAQKTTQGGKTVRCFRKKILAMHALEKGDQWDSRTLWNNVCPLLFLYPHGMTSYLSATSSQRLLRLQETNHPPSMGLSDVQFVIFVITLYWTYLIIKVAVVALHCNELTHNTKLVNKFTWATAACQTQRIRKSTAMFNGKLKKCSRTDLLVKDFLI